MIFQSFHSFITSQVKHLSYAQSRIWAIALTASLVTLTACGQGQPDSQATQPSQPDAVTSTDEGTASSDTSAESTSAQQELANHLNDVNATMYGAYWCPHCTDQKAMFGEAVSTINYVECDPEGENAQPQMCTDKGIEGFPTWEINGELYPGVHSLEQLADISNYEGSQDFE